MANAQDTTEMKTQFELKNAEELANFVKKHGLKGLYKEVKSRLNVWKTVPLNIGVIGGTGAGKSTFINTLRRLKPRDRGAAKTSVVEETKIPTPYSHPQNPKVMVWDLPGLGTAAFPKETYMEQINFTKYDFFIIICSTRFREDDLWFAEEVRKEGKQFYFVRTKIDDDIRHDREDYPDIHRPEAVLKKVKDDCIAQLLHGGFKDPPVFLVCKNPLEYEFAALEARLIDDRQELKRESFVLTLRSVSEEVIKEKTAYLQRRAWLAAAACVLIRPKPVKVLSIRVSTEKLFKQIMFYKRVYGLDHEGINQLSESSNVSKEVLTKAINQQFWFEFNDFSENTIVNEMKKSRVREASGDAPYLKLLEMPVIGFIFNCRASFEVTKAFLRSTIDSMDAAAIALLNAALSNATSREATREW